MLESKRVLWLLQLMCSFRAEMEIACTRIQCGGRRLALNTDLPAIFTEYVELFPEARPELLQFTSSYRRLVNVLCQVRDRGTAGQSPAVAALAAAKEQVDRHLRVLLQQLVLRRSTHKPS